MDEYNKFERYLLSAAAHELWLNPHDDKQFSIRPARLNPLRGHLKVAYTEIGVFRLPTSDHPYVLYETGQVNPDGIGLDTLLIEWVRLDKLVLDNELFCQVHIQERQLPLSACYIKRHYDKNILLAVDAKICQSFLKTQLPLYLHVYSNDWLSADGALLQDPVQEYSVQVAPDKINAAQILTRHMNQTTGNTYLTHNGYYVNNLSVSELAPGDTLGLLIDQSGLGYADFNYNDLRHFTSLVDQKDKVIIQMPERPDSGPLDTEPGDEVEIYLCQEMPPVGSQCRIKGIYYSRLHSSDLRMLTHRDFALNAERIDALLDEHREALNGATDPFIRVFYRKHLTGKKKGFDALYLHDMFRASIEDRLALMTDAPGTFDQWKAPALEASAVLRWQQASVENLTLENLKGIYSISRLNLKAGNHLLENEQVTCPAVFQIGGKLLCYDSSGKLISDITVPPNSQFTKVTVPAVTASVDCIPGQFTDNGSDFDRDMDFVSQGSYWDEKYYYRTTETEEWTEAVLGVDYDIDRETGEVRWKEIHETHGRMKRRLEDAIHFTLTREPEEMHQRVDLYQGNPPPTILKLARTDIYLNGYRLVEGIDYVIKDNRYVEFYNKQYYLGSDADIQLRFYHYGVPGNLSEGPFFGFIKHRYCRDTDPDRFFEYRTMSFTVDGKKANPLELGLWESPMRQTDPKYREGALYAAQHWPMLLGPWARLRLAADQWNVEMAASGSVSKLLNRPSVSGPVFIPHGHSLFSPFLKRMLLRLRRDELDVSDVGVSDAAVAMLMRPFLQELNEDILALDLEYEMVDIHPTPNATQVDITEEELLFLRAIDRLYIDNQIVFNTYTNIQTDLAPYTG